GAEIASVRAASLVCELHRRGEGAEPAGVTPNSAIGLRRLLRQVTAESPALPCRPADSLQQRPWLQGAYPVSAVPGSGDAQSPRTSRGPTTAAQEELLPKPALAREREQRAKFLLRFLQLALHRQRLGRIASAFERVISRSAQPAIGEQGFRFTPPCSRRWARWLSALKKPGRSSTARRCKEQRLQPLPQGGRWRAPMGHSGRRFGAGHPWRRSRA